MRRQRHRCAVHGRERRSHLARRSAVSSRDVDRPHDAPVRPERADRARRGRYDAVARAGRQRGSTALSRSNGGGLMPVDTAPPTYSTSNAPLLIGETSASFSRVRRSAMITGVAARGLIALPSWVAAIPLKWTAPKFASGSCRRSPVRLFWSVGASTIHSALEWLDM